MYGHSTKYLVTVQISAAAARTPGHFSIRFHIFSPINKNKTEEKWKFCPDLKDAGDQYIQGNKLPCIKENRI
jgi:hypothetical protein